MFDERQLNRLYRYCCALCDTREDAYDLLQSGVERCLPRQPDDPDRSLPYAMRVMRNLRRDELRRQRIVTFEPLDDPAAVAESVTNSLESLIISRDELEHVWRSMTVLEREVLYLWAVEGYSSEEIATQLERPRGSVLSVMHRMRKRMHHQHGKRQGASGP